MYDISGITQTSQLEEVGLRSHSIIQLAFMVGIMSYITEITQTSQSEEDQSNYNTSGKPQTSSCEWGNKRRQNKNQSYTHV